MDSGTGQGEAALAAQALEGLGYALYRVTPEGFVFAGGGRWAELDELVQASEFLEHYAVQLGEEADPSAVEPAIWTEAGLGLEARGLQLVGQLLVAVRDLGEEFEARRLLVQRANDQALDRRRLLKEVQKKEMLLRCIVHDLGNPLATVIMNLQRAERLISDPKALWSVQTALGQAARQRSLIRSVVDVFSAELAALEDFAFDPKSAPDLVAVAHSIIDAHRESANRGGIRLSFDDGNCATLPVRAEGALLERVIENLLANAVRHGGVDSEIRLSLAARDGAVEVSVEDEGPGVPQGMETKIFSPFVQGAGAVGQSGLGLFFCKRSVERWGGTIGCENRGGGGARFWFRLQTATSEREPPAS